MKNQDTNFKRALLKELTGFNYKEKEGNTIVPDVDDDDDAFAFTPVEQMQQSTAETVTREVEPFNPPVIEQDYSYTPMPRAQTESLGTTVVSRASIINGGIQTRENVTIEGVVNGDIASKGKVIVKGKVDGNISGFDAEIYCDELIGDINCEAKIVIQASTKIKGNLYSTRSTILGVVEGNITAKETVELSASAVVYGDIRSNTITIADGAVVYGMVTVGKSKPDTAPF